MAPQELLSPIRRVKVLRLSLDTIQDGLDREMGTVTRWRYQIRHHVIPLE